MVIPSVRSKTITVLAIVLPDVVFPTVVVDLICGNAVRVKPCKL